MSERLPSFSGLTAFYAAVRHGTLTGAARELNVSQPAITRRIAALEADLGVALFDRSHKPARLTSAGRDLMRALRSGFGTIEAAVGQLREGAKSQVVRVSAPSGFVAFWLIPQLAALEDAFPKTTIRIISQEYGEAERPGDVAIRFGLPRADLPDEVPILGNEVFAVASPLYLARRGLTAADADFGQMTLLTMEAARQHWHDWPSWFAAAGMEMPRSARQLDFTSYAMLVNAALAGQGVCLSWSGLLSGFLDTGAMVRIGDGVALSDRGYGISLRDGHAARAEVAEIRDWIIARAAETR